MVQVVSCRGWVVHWGPTRHALRRDLPVCKVKEQAVIFSDHVSIDNLVWRLLVHDFLYFGRHYLILADLWRPMDEDIRLLGHLMIVVENLVLKVLVLCVSSV